jgi:tetratricopeptide (TPR) repeat protein
MTYLRLSLVVALALGIVVAPVAEAQANRGQARAAFKQGRELFKQGKYAAAVKELQKAYDLSPHPALLRYLGHTYYKWNKPQKALEQFQRYAKQAPQAPDRQQIEAKIAELKKVLAAAKAPDPDKTDKTDKAGKTDKTDKPAKKVDLLDLRPTGEDDEMPDVFKKPKGAQSVSGSGAGGGTNFLTIAKWTSVGLAAAGFAMGITFNVMASGKASELEDAATNGNPDKNNPQTSFSKTHFDLQQAYKRNNTIAVVSYIAGGVFTAAAVALFIVDGGKKAETKTAAKRHNVALVPAIGPGTYGLTGSITF